MKITVTLLMTLLQLPLMGQLNVWDKDAITGNHIRTLNIYVPVPKTNPEHPLMLLQQYSFDSTGRVIKEVCKGCTGWVGGSRTDVVHDLIYEHDKLVKINRTGLEKETIYFFYDINKRIAITEIENGERVGIKLEYLDSRARDTLTYEAAFRNYYTIKDSVHQVNLKKEINTYDGQNIIIERYGSRDFIGFGQAIHTLAFTILYESKSPVEIEQALMSLNLQISQSGGQRLVRERNKERIQIKNKDTNEITAVYTLNEKGLVTEQQRVTGTDTLRFEYHYEAFD